jgi:hypothetical protein
MLVQVYGNNAVNQTAVYKCVKRFFLREEKVSLMTRDQDGQQHAELKKTLQKFVKFCFNPSLLMSYIYIYTLVYI